MKKSSLVFIVTLANSVLAASFEIDLSYGMGFPGFGINYAPAIISVYPWKHFGFVTGLENSIRAKTETRENTSSEIEMKSGKDDIVIRYSIDEYSEELSTQILQVPMMLKLRASIFYMAAGMKVGFPQRVHVNASYKGLKTEAYLPYPDATIDDLPDMSLGKLGGDSFRVNVKAKTLFIAAAESGIRIRIAGNFGMVICGFIDYPINKGFNRNLPPKFEWIESENENENNAVINIGDSWKSWHPWSVGGAAKLSFGFGGSSGR